MTHKLPLDAQRLAALHLVDTREAHPCLMAQNNGHNVRGHIPTLAWMSNFEWVILGWNRVVAAWLGRYYVCFFYPTFLLRFGKEAKNAVLENKGADPG